MTLHHFVLTMSGSAQPITTNKLLSGTYVSVQQDPANTHVTYIGGYNSGGTQVVSSSDYGIVLPAPSGGVAPAPYPLDPWNKLSAILLNDIWVLGTAGEKLAITYWTL